MACIQVPGAEVTVYRIQDPIKGDDHSLFDDGVLDAPPVTLQVCLRDALQLLQIWRHLRRWHAGLPAAIVE